MRREDKQLLDEFITKIETLYWMNKGRLGCQFMNEVEPPKYQATVSVNKKMTLCKISNFPNRKWRGPRIDYEYTEDHHQHIHQGSSTHHLIFSIFRP